MCGKPWRGCGRAQKGAAGAPGGVGRGEEGGRALVPFRSSASALRPREPGRTRCKRLREKTPNPAEPPSARLWVLPQPPGKPAHAPLTGGGPKSTAPSSATSTESRHRQAAEEARVRAPEGWPSRGQGRVAAGAQALREEAGAEERGPPAERCQGGASSEAGPLYPQPRLTGPGGGHTAVPALSVMCQSYGGARDVSLPGRAELRGPQSITAPKTTPTSQRGQRHPC